MFGRSASALVALLFFFPISSAAKRVNLASGAPVGLGFVAGLEQRPRSSFAAGNQTTTSNYSNYFLFQPYFDLLNIVFQPYVGWHFYPDLNGAGIDTRGQFTENSQAGNFSYGMRIMLSPYLASNMESRAYFVLAAGMANAKLKNTRIYRNASGQVTNSYTERVNGTGVELSAGVGFEFLLLQNYFMQIEAGYSQRNIPLFKYATDTDSGGNTRASGDDVTDAYGNKKGFHLWSPYVQLALNLNF